MKGKILKTMVIQMIGFIMGQCLILSYNPIGIAFFAASYILSPYRWVSIPVMIVSMCSAMGMLDSFKYIMAMLVIIACSGIAGFKKRTVGPYLLAAITGVSVFCMELSDTLMRVFDSKAVLIELSVGVLAAALTIVFYRAAAVIKEGEKNALLRNEEMISFSIIIGIIIYYITNSGVIPAGAAQACIFFVVLYFGFRCGAGMGAIIGSACGVVLGLAQNNFELLGIMCALGILAGAFRSIGRIGSVISFCCGVFLAGAVYSGTWFDLTTVKGLICASIIFLILPRSVVFQLDRGTIKSDSRNNEPSDLNDMGLNLIADSFKKLSNTFYNMPAKKTNLNNGDIEIVFEELTNNFCKSCENCNHCWKESPFNVYEETKILLNAAKNGGAISMEDIPETFSNRCVKSKALVSEINHLFERARLNLIWYNKLIESREVVADQLKEVAVIIEDYSKNIYNFVALDDKTIEYIRQKLRSHHIIMKKIVMLEKKNHVLEIVISAKTEKGSCVSTKDMANFIGECIGKKLKPMKNCKKLVGNDYATFNIALDTNFFVMHGTAKKTNSSEEISGDNFAVLNFGCGQMLASLSDGMGSGIYAYKDSETVIELLEQLLESGFSEEISLKLINSVMLLNNQAESPTTLDMAVVDMYSGMCDFIKLGAASTFIKRGNWVEAIKSTTLPVGVINDVEIESVSKKLYSGDFIIMVSDGITDMVNGEDKEREISKIIMDIDSTNPNEIAREILAKTVDNSVDIYDDDMTVLVLGLWEKCA